MVNVSDECLVFYLFWLRTMTESTWKIIKLDWKTTGNSLSFFLPKEWELCYKSHVLSYSIVCVLLYLVRFDRTLTCDGQADYMDR